MIVKFWDGKKVTVSDRKEAVQLIKAELQGWMQKGDRIVWARQPEAEELPSLAFVVNKIGEELDAGAKIV